MVVRTNNWLVVPAIAAVLAVGGGAGEAGAAPAAAADQPGFESAMVVDGVAVAVERAESRVVAGRDTTYTIAVTNRGDGTAQRLAVRVAVPPWMAAVRPHDGGESGDGYVEWPVMVAPGEVTQVRLTGAYDAAGPDTPGRVAVTACAVAPDDPRPIACATDVTALERGVPRTRWWLAAVAAALLIGAGLVLFARRAGLRGRAGRRGRAGFVNRGRPADSGERADRVLDGTA